MNPNIIFLGKGIILRDQSLFVPVCVVSLLLIMLIPMVSAENYSFVTKWGSRGTGEGQFNYPFSIAVDSSSNVYVSDTFNDRIHKFRSSGTFLAPAELFDDRGTSSIKKKDLS